MARGKQDRDALAVARSELQTRIGYTFSDQTLLTQALTHPSLGGDAGDNNQRLEFLGDRVINLIIADAIFATTSHSNEGDMARVLADCVDNESMAAVARGIDLGAALLTQPNSNLNNNDRALADALEALIGAIWRDGGMAVATQVVLGLWRAKLTDSKPVRDSKSQLQEYALATLGILPSYTLIQQQGPNHAPLFTVRASLGDDEAEADGKSLRHAERAAAKALLAVIDSKPKTNSKGQG